MPTSSRALLLAILALAGPVGCQPAPASTTVPDSAASTVISLREIDCQSCGERVVASLEERPGVYDASFDRKLAEITVRHDADAIGTEAFLAVVKEHGYTGIEGAGQGAYIPEIEFDPGLDVEKISKQGEAVELEDHLQPGKVTVFDFYAIWCMPCREVAGHMKEVLAAHDDVALRQLDIVDWDSEVAEQHLRDVPNLPYVVVYGQDGKRVAKISGLKLDELDAAIEKGRTR